MTRATGTVSAGIGRRPPPGGSRLPRVAPRPPRWPGLRAPEGEVEEPRVGRAPAVLAGNEGAPARAADGGPGLRLGDPPPAGREPVEVRRLHLLLAVAPEVAVPEVVGEDEDDVRRLARA